MARTGITILILGQGGETEAFGTAAADIIAPILMVVGVLLLSIILTMKIRGSIARRQAATPSPREQIERIKAGASGRDDLQSAGAELLQTAQRLAAQLDAKTIRLERLLAEAEQRIAELQDRPGAPIATPEDTATPPAGIEARPAPSEPPDPLTAAVYELADTGRSNVEIAQELQEQVGKVELILALREDAG